MHLPRTSNLSSTLNRSSLIINLGPDSQLAPGLQPMLQNETEFDEERKMQSMARRNKPQREGPQAAEITASCPHSDETSYICLHGSFYT